MLVYTWNTGISVNIVTQLAVQHSRFREFSDGYREIFRAVFLLFLCIFFRRKTVKGVYLDPSDAAFPRRCPDKPSRIVSTFQARDVIPILGRCVCQSKHFRNFIRCAFNYPWSCVRVSRMKGPEWNIDTLYVSRVERFNAPLMGTALYIYIYGENTRRVRVWMFNWTISKSKMLHKYIYLWKLKYIF